MTDEIPECRQCGCPPPTLQHYACGLCGYPTPAGDANAGRSPQYPIDPTVRPALAALVARRKAGLAVMKETTT